MPSLYQGGMQTLIVQLNLSVPLDLTEVVAIMFNGKNRDETSLTGPLLSASRAESVYDTIFSCAYQDFLLRVQVECFTSSFIS
jgi:hypothetical protein